MTRSSIATGCDVIKRQMTPKGFPLEGWDAHIRKRKLRNIRSSGAFSPEVTSSNVTGPRMASLGRVACAHVQPEVA